MKVFVWGYLHQCGGAGPEAGHAIELLCHNGVEVICVLKSGTDVLSASEPRRKYLDSIGVKTEEYIPGMLSGQVVWSWCEEDLFAHIHRHDEKPAMIAYWPCMNKLCDAEKVAVGMLPNLRILCQSNYQQEQLRREIAALGLKDNTELCMPYINMLSPWNNFRPAVKDYTRFDVLRIGRDDRDKYPDNLWDIIYRFSCPKTKAIHNVGWGANGREKLGDFRESGHPYFGKVTGTFRDHVYDPALVVDIIAACHVTLMYYPFIENYSRVALESMACGSVVVASDAGGMPELIEDGVTGYLCKTEEEVVYRLSELACDRSKRDYIAHLAHSALEQQAGNGENAFMRFSRFL